MTEPISNLVESPDPPPTLDYATPVPPPRAARIHRETAIGVFVADAVVILVAVVFGMRSWFVAGAVMLLNAPALPFACLFSSVLEGRDEPNAWVGGVRAVAMFLCEAIVSGLTWGWVVGRLRSRAVRPKS